MDNAGNSGDVGYGKPPKHTQFTKGKSGNPNGRPKGSKSLASIIDKVGRQPVKVTENGRTRTITKREAALTQLANKSASGDLRAIDQFTRLTAMAENSVSGSNLFAPDEKDRSVMKNLTKRIREAEPESPSEPTAEASYTKEDK